MDGEKRRQRNYYYHCKSAQYKTIRPRTNTEAHVIGNVPSGAVLFQYSAAVAAAYDILTDII